MTTVTAQHSSDTAYERHRPLFLGLAVTRVVLAVVAVPLAPFLYREHTAVLVLLRPTKEVLLLAGFVLWRQDASLPAVVAAALPLLLGGVWTFFALGRAYAGCLDDPDLPPLVRRLLPRDRIDRLTDAVKEQGSRVVFLGRLAAFPSTLVGAAAGVAEVPTKRFLLADAAGALVSLSALVGIGYVLGDTYEDAGPWLTAAGVAVLAAAVLLLGRSLRRAGRRR